MGFVRSRRGRGRFTTVSAVLFGVAALLSWWMLIEEGTSAARLLTAAAATVAAVVQIVAISRGRNRR